MTAHQDRSTTLDVAHLLRDDFPDAQCALRHDSPFQLLIATILAAQCTDERVNQVTPELFRRYPTPADFVDAELEEIETAIQSTGFFRNKAKSIQGCCRQLVARHGGDVPPELDELVELPGIGRKTANVVLGVAFGIASGVVVDTHVTRLSQRLGLTSETAAIKIEQDLMEQLPEEEWIDFSHRLILHGRQVCRARKPRCEDCSLQEHCPRIGVSS
ncbi:MAG: endonuclease III [Pirellulaceae bacterium]|jgi:endonuclease-3|nr:endonuclease III [Pirellulaceae bacterium]